MEYTIIRRTKFEGSTVEDMLSIQKTAKTLEEAIKYTTALKMLGTNKNNNKVVFDIVINNSSYNRHNTLKSSCTVSLSLQFTINFQEANHPSSP